MAKKEIALDANGKRKFGMRDNLAYMLGDVGCNMSFSLKGTVQTFWLVFMALETGLLSALLLAVQVWDAINDPLIGSLIDNDRRAYKHGKFKSYIFLGACGLLVGGAAVFLPFPNADLWLKCVLFILGYIIWDAFYTIANVPYGSMMNLITEDNAERASLSTWRSIGGMIGNVLPMVLLPAIIWNKVTWTGSTSSFWDKIAPTLVDKKTGELILQPEDFTHYPNIPSIFGDKAGLPYSVGDPSKGIPPDPVYNPLTGAQIEILNGKNVFWAALIMGVIGFIAFMFMLKMTTIRADENKVKTNETTKFNFFKSIGNFMKNRPAVGATVAAMGMFLGMQSASTANTIMFATYFGKASLSGLVMVIGFVPMFVFMPFVKKLVTKYGKKEASAVGAVASMAGSTLMFVFPLIPNKTVGLVIYIVALVIFGLGMGTYNCVSWALMADAIDYNEWKFGSREEGTIYSLHSFFRKLAQGVGPSIVLLVMGWLGYEAHKGTIGQSAQTAHNMCWLVAGLYALSAVLMLVGIAVIYNLSKKTTDQMQAELAARHAGEQPSEAPVEAPVEA